MKDLIDRLKAWAEVVELTRSNQNRLEGIELPPLQLALEQAADALEAQQWRHAEQTEPEEDEWVLATGDGIDVITAKICDGHWVAYEGGAFFGIQLWMPIPK